MGTRGLREPQLRGGLREGRSMSSNRILSHLSRADLRLLEPHLEAIDLPVRTQLESRNKAIRNVYFMESGFASVVANGSTKPSIEVGIIGREGMTGISVVLGSNDRATHETYIQVAGQGTTYERTKPARGDRAERRSTPRPSPLCTRVPHANHVYGARQRPQQD